MRGARGAVAISVVFQFSDVAARVHLRFDVARRGRSTRTGRRFTSSEFNSGSVNMIPHHTTERIRRVLRGFPASHAKP